MWECIKKLDKPRCSDLHISFVGVDLAGKKIKQNLKNKGIPTTSIVESKTVRTTEKNENSC